MSFSRILLIVVILHYADEIMQHCFAIKSVNHLQRLLHDPLANATESPAVSDLVRKQWTTLFCT